MFMTEENNDLLEFSTNNNLIRKITPTTHQDIETLNPTIYQDNQISLLNDQLVSPKNKKKELSLNNMNDIQKSNNSKRIDKNGNIICKKGKQKVTFIDKISNIKFVDIIKVESFKEYNKMEEITTNFPNHNGCCLIE